MFSLIITIISVALVAALALATLYYGGDAYESGQAKAEAAKLRNQGQQLVAAAEFYYLQKGEWPETIQKMVDDGFLTTVPVAQRAVLEEALAAKAWQMPKGGQPLFTFDEVTAEVCRTVNQDSYGLKGILPKLQPEYMQQCFGPTKNELLVVVGRGSLPDLVAAVNEGLLVPENVSDGPLPAPEDAAAWTVSPDGEENSVPSEPATPEAVGVLNAITSTDYGSVTPGQTVSRDFVFRNTGDAPAEGVYAEVLNAMGMALTNNSCGTAASPVSVEPGELCSFTASWTPSYAGSLSGARLAVQGAFSGTPAFLDLAGTSGVFNAAAAWTSEWLTFVPFNDTTRSYGVVSLGAEQSKFVVLKNIGTNGPLSVGFTLSGDGSQFKVKSVEAVSDSTNHGGGCVSGGAITGTVVSPCLTNAKPSGERTSVRLYVTYKPTEIGSHSLTLIPNTNNGTTLPEPLTLVGSGNWDAAAAWSSSTSALVAFDNTTRAFNTRTAGTYEDKVISLQNIGSNGAIAAGFTLSGDTAQFSIEQVTIQNLGGTASAGCESGGLAYDDFSSICLAEDKTQTRSNIRLRVRYAPTEVGNHSVTITPSTSNGTVLPEPLVLTGSAAFDASAAWSSSSNSLAAFNDTTRAFGTLSKGNTEDKTIYVRNVGTYGQQSTGFSLSGDVSQFQLRSVSITYPVAAKTFACRAGGVNSGYMSMSPCLADDVSHGASSSSVIQLVVRYAPTEVGNHSVSIVPSTNNGTTLPAPLVLTGSSSFNPTGAWSSSATSLVAFNDTTRNLGTKPVNTSSLHHVYIRNTGTNGELSLGFNVSGDTSHIKLHQVLLLSSTGGYETACRTGGSVSGGQSSTPCLSDEPNESRPVIRVSFLYEPKAVGNHSITITPNTNNGTVLPEPLVLTATGAFDATAAWSTASDSVQTPTSAQTGFGTVDVGTTPSKTFYVRNTGAYGAISVGFVLSGDTAHFKLTTVRRSTNAGTLSTCTPGGTLSADKLSATSCLAEMANETRPVIAFTLQYAPTAPGNHSVTVTPVSDNGTSLPAPLVLTGTGAFDAAAAWSSSPGSVQALSPAQITYGPVSVGSAQTKLYYLKNTGSYGALSVGFVLSGDTAHFKITSVKRVTNTSSSTTCAAGGTISSDKLSSTSCLVDVASGTRPNIELVVQYAPTAAGTHSVTLTPVTDNGTALPAPIVLTGSTL